MVSRVLILKTKCFLDADQRHPPHSQADAPAPHLFSPKTPTVGRGAYLSVANHDQADQRDVYVGSQGLIVVNLIHLSEEASG